MSEPTYEIVVDDAGNGSLSIFEDGEVFTVASDNPYFPLYMERALTGASLTDVKAAAPSLTPLTELSERVFVSENAIEFDGEPVHDSLAKTIQRYWIEQRPYGGLVKFMERLSLNTCEHSRNALYDWVNGRNMEIDNEGFLIAYKGVKNDMKSVKSGGAFVDDVWVDGRVPNMEGSVVSMARSDVEHDPRKGCSVGLHVGTKSYAQGWGNVLLTVRIDPVDVVSVPTDCSYQKMRVCRYKIIDIHDPQKHYEPIVEETEEFEDIEERLEEAVPDEAKGYVATMLARLRSKRP